MKSKRTYLILLFGLGMFCAHRYYIGSKVGVARLFSANYLMLGWFADMLYTGKTFDEAMAKRGYINTTKRL